MLNNRWITKTTKKSTMTALNLAQMYSLGRKLVACSMGPTFSSSSRGINMPAATATKKEYRVKVRIGSIKATANSEVIQARAVPPIVLSPVEMLRPPLDSPQETRPMTPTSTQNIGRRKCARSSKGEHGPKTRRPHAPGPVAAGARCPDSAPCPPSRSDALTKVI